MYYQQLAVKRRIRVRSKIKGTEGRPRLTIHRSNKHTYLQVVNDALGLTVASANSKSVKTGTKTEKAKQVTTELLKQLETKGISALVFDRGSYRYHGRIKAIAEILRTGNIKV